MVLVALRQAAHQQDRLLRYVQRVWIHPDCTTDGFDALMHDERHGCLLVDRDVDQQLQNFHLQLAATLMDPHGLKSVHQRMPHDVQSQARHFSVDGDQQLHRRDLDVEQRRIRLHHFGESHDVFRSHNAHNCLWRRGRHLEGLLHEFAWAHVFTLVGLQLRFRVLVRVAGSAPLKVQRRELVEQSTELQHRSLELFVSILRLASAEKLRRWRSGPVFRVAGAVARLLRASSTPESKAPHLKPGEAGQKPDSTELQLYQGRSISLSIFALKGLVSSSAEVTVRSEEPLLIRKFVRSSSPLRVVFTLETLVAAPHFRPLVYFRRKRRPEVGMNERSGAALGLCADAALGRS
eukprot:scaffold2808_cov255-Pinguiococcus_pyrenoidosus.AAC.6